jgi:hypothetical protein
MLLVLLLLVVLFQKETNGKEWYLRNYSKTFSSSGGLLRSFIKSFLGPTSKAGTLLPDVGPNPYHQRDWILENSSKSQPVHPHWDHQYRAV